jgi:hypothetical protein
MIFDAVEVCASVLATNFATDLAGLAMAKGVTITTTADIVKRQDAETFLALNQGKETPTLGVDALSAATQGRDQGKRDTRTEVSIDYYCEADDPATAGIQSELAAEAILLTMDRLPTSGSGVFGIAEEPESARIEMTKGYVEAKAATSGRRWWRLATVQFPVYDRDTV